MKNLDISNSQVTMLIEVGGEVHLVGMDPDSYKLLSDLIKQSISTVVPTGVTQSELRKFVGLVT